MSPIDDQFLSSSADGTVRLWDLRQSNSIGVLQTPSGIPSSKAVNPIVTWDPSGLVFAIAHNSRFLRMYDARNFDQVKFFFVSITSMQGPFETRDHSETSLKWHSIKFSNDSKKLIVSTNGAATLLFNGNTGEQEYTLTGIFIINWNSDKQDIIIAHLLTLKLVLHLTASTHCVVLYC